MEPASQSPVIVLVAVGTTSQARVFDPGSGLALGRTIDAVELDDHRVSRDHAHVRFDHGTWIIADRGSHNGTFVDSGRVTGEVRRRDDCVVRLGHSIFLLVRDGRGYHAVTPDRGEHVIGPELARTFDQARDHANERAVVVHGERGSGKELVARYYHDAGPRAGGPFVAVDCAAIPQGDADRLLFGSRKAPGRVQSARGGTLFLDAIAELDPAVQAKLLRVLEPPNEIDVGIAAAIHRDLRMDVAAGHFRGELYDRLARAEVRVPPLRARRLDLARLVVRELAAVDRRMSPHARLIEACCIRPWPGNVRELRSAVRIAATAARLANHDVVRPEDLPADAGMAVVVDPTPLIAVLPAAGLDRAAVVDALAHASGVVSDAARALGLHRTQLYRLMDELGIANES